MSHKSLQILKAINDGISELGDAQKSSKSKKPKSDNEDPDEEGCDADESATEDGLTEEEYERVVTAAVKTSFDKDSFTVAAKQEPSEQDLIDLQTDTVVAIKEAIVGAGEDPKTVEVMATAEGKKITFEVLIEIK